MNPKSMTKDGRLLWIDDCKASARKVYDLLVEIMNALVTKILCHRGCGDGIGYVRTIADLVVVWANGAVFSGYPYRSTTYELAIRILGFLAKKILLHGQEPMSFQFC
jgi:hypothetical protein